MVDLERRAAELALPQCDARIGVRDLGEVRLDASRRQLRHGFSLCDHQKRGSFFWGEEGAKACKIVQWHRGGQGADISTQGEYFSIDSRRAGFSVNH